MKRLAFINEKGGTGKTTLAANMAAYLAQKKNLRVLCVDMDTQGHLGKSLGVEGRLLETTISELLNRSVRDWRKAAQPTRIDNLHVLPSDKRLAQVSVGMGIGSQDAARLHRILAQVEESGEYDVVIIDSPPSVGPLSLNVMVSASDVIVPVQLAYLALEGCADVVETIESVRTNYSVGNPQLGAVVATFYRRTNLAHEILNSLNKAFGSKLARSVVGYSVKIDEAQSHGQTIFEYAPGSTGAQVFERLGDELYKKVITTKRR